MAVLASGLAVTGAAVAWSSTAAGSPPDLSIYAYSTERRGNAPSSSGPPISAVARLKTRWHDALPGAINTQPLVAHGVSVHGHRRDLLFVGTEHGEVFALAVGSGQTVWRRSLGAQRLVSECEPSPDHMFGISGTPTLDRHAGRLYVVDGRGFAWALSLGSGSTVPGWPVQVTGAGTSEYGAVTLSRGRLYAAIASPCDDGFYQGGVVAVDVRAPGQRLRWNVLGNAPPFYGGGIWSWGGASVDPRDGDVYVATGNANFPAAENAGYAERVVRLGPTLKVRQSDYPLREPFYIGDRDFGSTPVLFRAKGCPAQLVALNKTGDVFLYDRSSISQGPRQRLKVADVRGEGVPLVGLPAFDTAHRTLVLLTPADAPNGGPRRGLVAYRLSSACRLVSRWQHGFDVPSSGSQPIISGGVVYVGSGRTGWLRAFGLADGHQLWSVRLGLSVYAAPSVIDGGVYAADWRGGIWAFRPRARVRR